MAKNQDDELQEGVSMSKQGENISPEDTRKRKGGRAKAGMYGDDTGSEGMNNDTPYDLGDEDSS